MASEPATDGVGPEVDDDARSSDARDRDQATEAKREAILDAALEVFAARGYKGATIKAIAAEADLRSAALLYWYFPNKAELFAAVLQRFLPVLADLPEGEVLSELLELPPEVFLRGVMEEAFRRFADPRTRQAFWLIVVEWPLLQESNFSMGEQRPTNVYTLVRDYFDRQAELGALRVHDSGAAARIVIGQLNLALQVRTAPMGLLPPPPGDDELIEQTLDILLDGLRPRD